MRHDCLLTIKQHGVPRISADGSLTKYFGNGFSTLLSFSFPFIHPWRYAHHRSKRVFQAASVTFHRHDQIKRFRCLRIWERGLISSPFRCSPLDLFVRYVPDHIQANHSTKSGDTAKANAYRCIHVQRLPVEAFVTLLGSALSAPSGARRPLLLDMRTCQKRYTSLKRVVRAISTVAQQFFGWTEGNRRKFPRFRLGDDSLSQIRANRIQFRLFVRCRRHVQDKCYLYTKTLTRFP